LVIDPEPDPNPLPTDEEEFIKVHRVSIEELKQIFLNGNMMLHSVQTSVMALNYLEKNGYS